MSQQGLDLLNALTDEELSSELHRRRKSNRDAQENAFIKFSEQIIVVLDEFEKITGKRIVRRAYGGYYVEEKK